MLDIKLIKENPQSVIDRLRAKGKEAEADICRVIELDAKRRELIASSESLKAEQNKTTKLVPIYKKEGKDCAPIFAQMKELGAKVKEQEEELKQVETEYNSIMLSFPNLPDPDVVPGGKETISPFITSASRENSTLSRKITSIFAQISDLSTIRAA